MSKRFYNKDGFLKNNAKPRIDNDKSMLFAYLNKNSNTKLSQISGLDLQELIVLIDEYQQELRDNLGLDQNITFGLELEFEHANRKLIDEDLQEAGLFDRWRTHRDSSLNSGGEISSPVLRDQKKNWQQLKEVCSIVQNYAVIDKKSGGHIHVGTQALGGKTESWLNFLKLWSVYENVIYRFSYGEYLTARPSMSFYAKPRAMTFDYYYHELRKKKTSIKNILDIIPDDKYHSVTFINVSSRRPYNYDIKNTIEFRCPNGTLNPIIWQNNVDFLVKFLLYAKSKDFNHSIINQRAQIVKEYYNRLDLYDEIFLNQALELSDMIFSNNYDKICFLKQYLKSFQINDHKTPYIKNLIKKRDL